jgi:hypothetical protein
MDNIGGINKARYCFSTDVETCVVLTNKICISLIKGKVWKDFQATPGKIEITVTPTDVTNNLYTVSGTIFIPKLHELTFCEKIQFKSRRILIEYTTNNGDVLIAGDKENSIRALVEDVTPSAASGYSGHKITISGTMKHTSLPLF